MGRLLADISEVLPPSLWHEMEGDVQAELQAALALLAGPRRTTGIQ
jgi:hypothetical protein